MYRLALAKSKLAFQSIYFVHDLLITENQNGLTTAIAYEQTSSHTYISKSSNTHQIGLTRSELFYGLRSLADTLHPTALIDNILQWHSDSSKHTAVRDINRKFANLHAPADTGLYKAKRFLSISIRAKNLLSNVLIVGLKALYLIALVIAVIARTAYYLVKSAFFLGQAGAYAAFVSNTQTSHFSATAIAPLSEQGGSPILVAAQQHDEQHADIHREAPPLTMMSTLRTATQQPPLVAANDSAAYHSGSEDEHSDAEHSDPDHHDVMKPVIHRKKKKSTPILLSADATHSDNDVDSEHGTNSHSGSDDGHSDSEHETEPDVALEAASNMNQKAPDPHAKHGHKKDAVCLVGNFIKPSMLQNMMRKSVPKNPTDL